MTAPGITGTELTAAQVAGVLALVEAARLADGVAPLSEHAMLHLRYYGPGEDPDLDFVLTAEGEVAGYAHVDRPGPASQEPDLGGELVIHPARRRRGFGRILAGELVAAAAGSTLRLWAHGDLPAAAALAGAAGFERFRALWQMRHPLRGPLDPAVLPAGYRLRTFVPGQDEEAWLSLNGRAFAKHPEQGGWTRHDLDLRERERWFDPAGFFLAEKDGALAGFHWTKVHDQDPGEPPGTGEVYVVGVDPAAQGTGLGRALTLAGLHHLRAAGATQAILYADEDNMPAIRMYEALGFTRSRIDVMYRKPASAGRGRTTP